MLSAIAGMRSASQLAAIPAMEHLMQHATIHTHEISMD